MTEYTQLTEEERTELYRLLKDGITRSAIAKALGRCRTTIYREIRRNSSNIGYLPDSAAALAKERCWSGDILQRNPDIRQKIIAHLNADWSPEQIAGRWRLGGYGCTISHETIYRHIYSQHGRKDRLHELLPRRHKKRGMWFGRTRRKSGIPDRVPITQRHANIDNRHWFGHWEADLVWFNNRQTTSLVTMVERKTRLTLFTKNYHKTSGHTLNAIKRIMDVVPKNTVKSITFDNGLEFAKHKQLGIDTFFSEPYSPWQKGAIENANGRIRRFLPSNTIIKNVPMEEIKNIEWRMNNTPRKCLNYLTPLEAFFKLAYKRNYA